MKKPFIGRKKELRELNAVLEKKTANLIVIKGRRRIGKSTLIEEFAQSSNYQFYSFSGIPPTRKIKAQDQRNEFARQIGEQLGLSGLKANDWGDLFLLLAKSTQTGRVIILLDEISWMGSKDATFLGKLKTTWDRHFKKNPQLILILCGSVSSWIEKNIISSTGFLGRISLKINLEELSLPESNQFFNLMGFRGSNLEKFILLGAIGGIPWYHELVQPQFSASENIKKLFFEPNGILVDEYSHIFHDLFGRRSKNYREIVEYLAKGPAEYEAISQGIKYARGGQLNEYLDELVTSGFVSRDYTWSLQSGKESNLSHYRLRDNYLRFYLKYVARNLNKIKKGQLQNISLVSLPAWEAMMGLQFENMVLNNRKLIWEALGIRPEEIVSDNPFFQRQRVNQRGCQIDYLIQTRFNNLYVCEIKFSRNNISTSIVDEVRQKINRLKRPKSFSCIPILIHSNGINDEIRDTQYFGKIIDFGQLLESA